MPSTTSSGTLLAAAGALLLAPALHPLLRTALGPPSHLLWFVHVLPVALVTYRWGKAAGTGTVVASTVLVTAGEASFGSGYGVPAPTETVVAMAVAVAATNMLVGAFALYARAVTRRYRLLFDNADVGIIRVGAEDRIVAVNPAAREMIGTVDALLEGRHLGEVFVSPPFASVEELGGGGPGWSGRLEVAAGGDVREIDVFLAAVPNPDGPGHQVIVSDRSLEVAQDREIERQSKLAALGEGLAGVAHELNNPLTVIIAHAQLGLALEPADGEIRESFEVVNEQGQRMRKLVGELLGFSRPAAAETTTVHELIHRIVKVQRIAHPGVHFVIDTEWKGQIRANPDKVEQIVLNLLANAAYEVEKSGGTVEVSSRDAGSFVEVGVSDDGPGIAPEVLPKIFEPFVTTKPDGEGTGLGLAICRRLARGWGGELEAHNRPRGGATFVLRLPKGIAVDLPAGDAARSGIRDPCPDGSAPGPA